MTKHLSFGAHARRRQVFFCFGKVWRELAWNTVHKSQALHHSAVVLLIVKAFLRMVFFIAFPFLIVNAILAVTDQFGLLDLMVLLLDLLILALLVLTKKAFTPKQYADVA